MAPNIIYDTLRNLPQLTEYWSLLTEMGLLEHDIPSQTFKTTEKGLRFLKVINKADENREHNNKDDDDGYDDKTDSNNSTRSK